MYSLLSARGYATEICALKMMNLFNFYFNVPKHHDDDHVFQYFSKRFALKKKGTWQHNNISIHV